MTWICPKCGKSYAANTLDEMCEEDDCWGVDLEEKSGNEVVLNTKPMEGLCVLVCDVSASMEEPAFPPSPETKSSLVASAIDLAIRELKLMGKADNAYIAVVAFGERAALIHGSDGKPFIKSIRQIISEYPSSGDLGRYLDDVIKNDRAGVGSRRTNITAGLELAKGIYDAVAVPGGTLRQYGFSGPVDIMTHRVTSAISVPNIRIMAYSDGAHNPEDRRALSNPFLSLSPSPLMTAFIGDENHGDNRQGAEQMRQISTTCPIHGHSGFFLINTIGRHARLKSIFRMASGASGFCPQCLAGEIVGGKSRE